MESQPARHHTHYYTKCAAAGTGTRGDHYTKGGTGGDRADQNGSKTLWQIFAEEFRQAGESGNVNG